MAEVMQRRALPTSRSTGVGSDVDPTLTRRGQNAPPRSDIGTIILHWTTAIAFVVSLLTGIRMATFGSVLPGLSQWLSPIMPQGEMWTWHFVAGLGLFFCASAYLVYLNRSGLTRSEERR